MLSGAITGAPIAGVPIAGSGPPVSVIIIGGIASAPLAGQAIAGNSLNITPAPPVTTNYQTQLFLIA